MISIGAVLMGIAVKMFFDSGGLVTGGVSGIGIIIEHLIGVPIFLTNIILNIPLFIYGFKILSKRTMIDSLYANIVFTVTLAILPEINPVEGELILTAVAGGVLMGCGLGLILRADATSGGVDLLAVIIQKKNKRLKVVWVIFFIDAAIIAVGTGIFGIVAALYAVIAVFIISYVSDKITEGPSISKTAYIVSKHSIEISKLIMEKMERGVTGINAKGMFTGSEKTMIVCVIRRNELRKLKELVESVDEAAFMWIGDATEVLGEGFVKSA